MFHDSYFSTRLRQNRRDAAQSVPLQHGKKIPTYWAGGGLLQSLPISCLFLMLVLSSITSVSMAGTQTVCRGNEVSYSTITCPGDGSPLQSAYNWHVYGGAIITPTNKSSITVSWGSNPAGVRVSCSSSSAGYRSWDVNVLTTPSTPSPISGPTEVEPYKTYTYTVPSVYNADYYTWYIPEGWKINGKLGSGHNLGTSVQITPGGNSLSGKIQVRAVISDCKNLKSELAHIIVKMKATYCEFVDKTCDIRIHSPDWNDGSGTDADESCTAQLPADAQIDFSRKWTNLTSDDDKLYSQVTDGTAIYVETWQDAADKNLYNFSLDENNKSIRAYAEVVRRTLLGGSEGSWYNAIHTIYGYRCDEKSFVGKPTITSSDPNWCSGTTLTASAHSSDYYSYQWYKDSIPITGATGRTYIATSEGYYQVSYVGNGEPFGKTDANFMSASVTVKKSPTITGFSSGGLTVNSPVMVYNFPYTLPNPVVNNNPITDPAQYVWSSTLSC